jgi:chromosome partitioning protein
MIDYDPQFNLSQASVEAGKYFSLEKARRTTLAILMDAATTQNPYQIQVPGNHNPPAVSSLATSIHKQSRGPGQLDIVPSTLDLMYVALGQATAKTDPIEERFRKFAVEARSIYDVVLIDCHPAGSLFTRTSLTNSDYVLIPVMPQKYAVRGIGLMMEFIEARRVGVARPEPIILFNATPRTGVSVEETSIRSDPKYASYCLPSTLKYYKAFAEPEGGKHFVWMSKKPYSDLAFHNLLGVARDLRKRIKI